MSLTKTVGFFAGTTLAIGGVAFGADQTNYASEIASLKAEIASMKSAQGDSWLTEQRAAEIRGIVTDVLADADTRSSLQGSGSGAGYDGGFFLSSADGNYSMKINLLQQIRWSFNDNDSPAGGAEEQSFGFENKRTRLTFSGNMVDSSWSYKVAYYLGTSNDVEGFSSGTLSDAWVSKDFGNGFAMYVGQFRLPFGAEYGLDAGNLQFTDYSVAASLLGPGSGQGVMFGYSADVFRVNAAYVNGLGQVNQAWAAGSPDSDWAFAGRAEFKAAGNWSNDAQSWKGEEFSAVIGGGFAIERDDASSATPWRGTIDATIGFGGANLVGAFFYSDNDAATESTGFTVSGGVFVSDDIEIVARFENLDIDAPGAGSDLELNTLTGGANWYFAKNTAKLGLELGYAFDAVPTGAQFANWTQSTDDGQWVLRGQMSFSF
jgi:hypothetical protein